MNFDFFKDNFRVLTLCGEDCGRRGIRECVPMFLRCFGSFGMCSIFFDFDVLNLRCFSRFVDVCRCLSMFVDVFSMFVDVCRRFLMFVNVCRCFSMFLDVCRSL